MMLDCSRPRLSNARREPSGDHLGTPLFSPDHVSRRGLAPLASAIQISGLPERNDMKATLRPSGENCGKMSGAVEEINLAASDCVAERSRAPDTWLRLSSPALQMSTSYSSRDQTRRLAVQQMEHPKNGPLLEVIFRGRPVAAERDESSVMLKRLRLA